MYPFCVCIPLWILPNGSRIRGKQNTLNIQVTWEGGQRSIGSQKELKSDTELKSYMHVINSLLCLCDPLFFSPLLLWKLNFNYNHSTSSLSIFERRHADDENQNRFDESLEDGCLCNKSINIYYRRVIHQKKKEVKKLGAYGYPGKVHEHTMREIYIKFSMPPRVIIFAPRRCGPEREILFN